MLDIKLEIMKEEKNSQFNQTLLLNGYVQPWEDRVQAHINDRIHEAFTNYRFAIEQGHPEFHVMYSGGKDSTTVLVLLLEYLKTYPQEDLPEKVNIYFTDTLMEIPTLLQRALEFLVKLQQDIDDEVYPVPIQIHINQPELLDSFWVLVLGKGYVLPSIHMRWCTDRLKIKPAQKAMVNTDKEKGIILIGVRFGESKMRDRLLVATCARGGECGQGKWYTESKGMKTLAPIINARTCDVWDILNIWADAKGYFTKGLQQIYLDEEETRFGCWSCPVINKDKTMEKLVNTPKGAVYGPLLAYRKLLKEFASFEKHPAFRVIRNNSKPGRLTLLCRKLLLEILLETQEKVGFQLITPEEIEKLKLFWEDPVYDDEAYGKTTDQAKEKTKKQAMTKKTTNKQQRLNL